MSINKIIILNCQQFTHIILPNKDSLSGKDENDNILDTMEEYDSEGDSWTILDTHLNTPRVYFGASVVPRSLVGC